MSASGYTRLGFAGTPAFAATILQALCDAGRAPLVVLTQPDRGSGRGRKVTASPVKQLARKRGIDVWQPPSLKAPDAIAQLEQLGLDALIVAAYGLILPPAALAAPRHGCLNVHASLLPRWRGAAPVQAAIVAGDEQTGVTIMQMDAGLDTGPMLRKRTCAITCEDTAEHLTQRLAGLGARCLLEVLADGPEGIEPEVQDDAIATYAGRIDKQVAELDFTRDAAALARAVRAYDPWPVAYTELAGERLRIWRAHRLAATANAPPGTIVGVGPEGLDVATGEGTLRVLELQRAGGKRMPIEAYLRARDIPLGQRLGGARQPDPGAPDGVA